MGPRYLKIDFSNMIKDKNDNIVVPLSIWGDH